jgi:hypothetical protein
MKRIFIIIFLIAQFGSPYAQTSTELHPGGFKKNKMLMSSNPYKPDDWERPYYDSSIKTVFPSDLIRSPENYKDKLIHLIGIVDSVYISNTDSTVIATFLLDNKYWDYIEDYSIQDEVMFISEKGDGKFWVTLTGIQPGLVESIRKFADEQKLFFVYGNFKGLSNGYPVLAAQQIKYIDYEFYTTHIFYYEVERNKKGDVVVGKKGKVQLTNFKFLKIAQAGQNK